ncbi:MAG: hypothetical protein NZ774_06165 [Candidatus Poseidoniales archaeon]|nr:hypothetical protein [Candidatus Poseidoniales archaeon]
MFDDGSDELLGGFWPFMKRALFLFLPIWVGLIVWSAGYDYIRRDVLLFMSTIAAGLSLPLILMFEKIKLKQQIESESDSDKVIK